jgi:hypothetical protein
LERSVNVEVRASSEQASLNEIGTDIVHGAL